MPRQYTPRVHLICAHCSKPFSIPPSRAAEGRGRFCSRDCQRAAYDISRTCQHCGTFFTVSPRQIANGEGRYCSVECQNAGRVKRPIRERFWQKVEKTDSCWLWKGSKTPDGYGLIQSHQNGKKVVIYAHRLSWQMRHGYIPPGKVIRHRCHNPSCVNPSHLLLGSHADNAADRVAADHHAYGSRTPLAILDERKVRSIRLQYAAGDITQQELANDFGVHIMTINGVINRRTWKHVS